jgi:hypothetical protein
MSLFSFSLSMQIHIYTSAPYTFSKSKNKFSINSQTHYTKNNWPNFNNLIAMNDEEWEK